MKLVFTEVLLAAFIWASFTPFFSIPMADETFDPTTASLDDLMYHASRYGNTAGKRALKKAAGDELLEGGLPAFQYLVERVYMENMWFYIYARKMLKELPDEEAAGVLIGLVGPRSSGLTLSENPAQRSFAPHELSKVAENRAMEGEAVPSLKPPGPSSSGDVLTEAQEKRVRRISVFFLGYCDTPQHAETLRPLLGDEDLCGAAARTLGKWKDSDSVSGIIKLLNAEKESQRIKAAVALGEIGDRRAIKPLIAALSDPVFTVRNSAAESLAAIPVGAVGEEILESLPGFSGKALRQAVRVLGEIRHEAAKPLLLGMLSRGDPWLCGDAVFSLRQLGVDLGEWRRENEKMAGHGFVKARLTAPVVPQDR